MSCRPSIKGTGQVAFITALTGAIASKRAPIVVVINIFAPVTAIGDVSYFSLNFHLSFYVANLFWIALGCVG